MNDLPGYQPHPGVLDSGAAVAAACMTGARYVDAVAEILTEDDFHNLGHASVFAAAAEISGRGGHVDAASVRNLLIRNGNIRTLGADGGRLMDLMHIGAAPLDGVRYHADIVHADAIRRRAHAACIRGAQITSEATFEAEHIGLILDELGNAAPDSGNDRPLWVRDGLEDFLDSLDKPVTDTVLPTPWSDLDQHVKLRTGQLVVAGARPGGGKSLFGMQVAAKCAIDKGIPTLMLSMEMRRAEVLRRLYAAQASVSLDALNNHTLSDDDHARIDKVTGPIRTAPLVIDDSPHATIGHLRSRLRWMARTAPVKLVVVDYVQLMISSRKNENRALEVAELTRGLKVLAMELDVCVIALAQLNRGLEQRASRKPALGDLRESGSLENDADTVLFMNPEPETDGIKRLGDIDIVIAKQRSGPHGIDVPLTFEGKYARFRLQWTPHKTLRGSA